MTRMSVVYVAGPYRAETPWQILRNIRTAQEAALEIWKHGAVALCPHANTALFDGEAPDAVWLAGGHELLRRCDAVFMSRGWSASQGAIVEKELAVELGLPVLFNFKEVADWLALVKETV